jgi:hypothetical protein
LTWNEESDKHEVAKAFAQEHASDIEGLGCKTGNPDCFANILFTHMLKMEEETDAQFPPLLLAAEGGHEHHHAIDPFEEGRKIREAEGFNDLGADATAADVPVQAAAVDLGALAAAENLKKATEAAAAASALVEDAPLEIAEAEAEAAAPAFVDLGALAAAENVRKAAEAALETADAVSDVAEDAPLDV